MAYDNENKIEEFEEERKEIWILLAVIMGLTIAVMSDKNPAIVVIALIKIGINIFCMVAFTASEGLRWFLSS